MRVRDNGERNMKFRQAKFIDMGSLSRDSAFFVIAQGVKKGSNSLLGYLAKTWTKDGSQVSELEMPGSLWFNVEEGIQRLREIGMLE